MSKVVVIGLVGKSDFLGVDHFCKEFETLPVNSFHIEYGGKGFNQALTLQMLGNDVLFATHIGDDDIYQEVKRLLKEVGLKTKFMVEKGERSAEAIILTRPDSVNQVICYSGCSLNFTKDEVNLLEEEISKAKYLLLQLELSDESLYQALDIAFKHHVKVILNPAPYHKIKEEYLKKCYLLTPNEIEASQMLNREITKDSDISSIDYDKMIITLGKDGFLLKDGTLIKRCQGNVVKAVDSTGAGDVFNGALVDALIKGLNLVDAATYANKMASISVQYPYVLPGIYALKEQNK